jgi:hypothetical protein
MAEKLCLSCGKSDPECLDIFGAYLCPECESRLVKSDPAAADYSHWMASCRKLWENLKTKFVETTE